MCNGLAIQWFMNKWKHVGSKGEIHLIFVHQMQSWFQAVKGQITSDSVFNVKKVINLMYIEPFFSCFWQYVFNKDLLTTINWHLDYKRTQRFPHSVQQRNHRKAFTPTSAWDYCSNEMDLIQKTKTWTSVLKHRWSYKTSHRKIP